MIYHRLEVGLRTRSEVWLFDKAQNEVGLGPSFSSYRVCEKIAPTGICSLLTLRISRPETALHLLRLSPATSDAPATSRRPTRRTSDPRHLLPPRRPSVHCSLPLSRNPRDHRSSDSDFHPPAAFHRFPPTDLSDCREFERELIDQPLLCGQQGQRAGELILGEIRRP